MSFKHLRVFGYRVFVHITKDERSKLDIKSKQSIFLGYGHEDFGYRLYDPIEKKVIRSRDVVFFEDQTIEDIDKGDNSKFSDDIPASSNSDPDPMPVPVEFNQGGVEIEQREDVNDDDNSTTDEVEHEAPPTPPPPPQDEIRRSTRERRPSSRYYPHEYLLLIDGGEPESYSEALEHENKKIGCDPCKRRSCPCMRITFMS